ncbi:hypothetical protein GGF31_001039 [Allomyces arbusculus]|nr:hypothetical protein GGF31_001039 [Allomyces arbusculus]
MKGERDICHAMKIVELTKLGEQWERNLAAAVDEELEAENAWASANEQAGSAGSTTPSPSSSSSSSTAANLVRRAPLMARAPTARRAP